MHTHIRHETQDKSPEPPEQYSLQDWPLNLHCWDIDAGAPLVVVIIIISPTFQNLLHQMQLSCVVSDELTVTINLIDPFWGA